MLTAVMILGVIAVVVTLVTRLPRAAALSVPDGLAMPAGAVAVAVTQGPGWWAVVTRDGRILVFGPDGALRDEVAVSLP